MSVPRVAEAQSSYFWSAPTKIDDSSGHFANSLVDVSCASASFCAAIDYSGHALTWNGSSWSAPDEVDNTGSGTGGGVSCASPSFCISSDTAGQSVLMWDGSSWSAPADIDNGDGVVVSSSSCASPSFCVAAGSSGSVLTWNGSSWSAPDKIDGTNELARVSCVSASFCAAVDDKGRALTWNGSSWSAPDDIDGTKFFYALSCASASFCVAIDQHGHVLTWTGSSWSAPVNAGVQSGPVSCVSASLCVAMGPEAGSVVTWNGTSWSAPDDIDGTNTLTGVSCTSASFCVAIDGDGNVLTGRVASPGPVGQTSPAGPTSPLGPTALQPQANNLSAGYTAARVNMIAPVLAITNWAQRIPPVAPLASYSVNYFGFYFQRSQGGVAGILWSYSGDTLCERVTQSAPAVECHIASLTVAPRGIPAVQKLANRVAHAVHGTPINGEGPGPKLPFVPAGTFSDTSNAAFAKAYATMNHLVHRIVLNPDKLGPHGVGRSGKLRAGTSHIGLKVVGTGYSINAIIACKKVSAKNVQCYPSLMSLSS